MSKVAKRINLYYRMFESYSSTGVLKTWWFYWSLLSILAFVLSVLFDLVNYKKDGISSFLLYLLPVMFFEIIGLICWHNLQKYRNDEIAKRCQRHLNVKQKNIKVLKEIWIKRYISSNTTSYLGIAESIEKVILIKERNKSQFYFGRRELISLVYTVESRPRVLALLMAFGAAVIALSVRGGATVDNVFEYYQGATIKLLLGFAFMVSFFLMLTSQFLKFIFIFLLLIYDMLFDWRSSISVLSPRKTKFFVNQLIQMYDLEKNRFPAYHAPSVSEYES